MTFQNGAMLYTQGFGSRPENVEIPHLDTRAPTSSDVNGYPIGKRWINTATNTEYVLTSTTSSMNVTTPTWTLLGTNSGALNTLTGDSGGAISPSAGNITLAGTANQITTAGSGSTITYSLIGPYTPSTYTAHAVLLGEGTSSISSVGPGTSGIPLIGQGASSDPVFGTAIVAGGGTGATTLTAHGVLVGEGTSAITALSVGTTGQVLIGSTGADPAFGALGVNSGLTVHGVLLGENNSAIAATTAGSNGQVLLGSTGADPAFGTLTTSTGIGFTTGAHSLALNIQQNGFAVNAASTGVSLVAQNSYTVTQSSQTSFALPATAAVGDTFIVASATGNTSGWIITQGASQEIWANTNHTTNGATGTLAGLIHTSVVLMCVVANNEFIVIGGSGLTGLTFT
jgi:hypothetical protein